MDDKTEKALQQEIDKLHNKIMFLQMKDKAKETLLDKFAAKAMQGSISKEGIKMDNEKNDYTEWVKTYYDLAESMMKEREKRMKAE